MLTVTNLPQALPVPEAARRAGLTEDELQKMIQSGRIVAFASQDGEVLIPVDAQGKLLMLAPPAEAEQPQSQQSQNGNGHLDDDLNARLARIRREDFAHLEGVPITAAEAARKYGVNKYTILAWTRRYDSVLRVLKRGYRMLLDEAGVAYLATIHHLRKEFGSKSGSPLVDERGAPNLIKHPTLSAYRRRRQS